MVFSSIPFLYYFLPVVFFFYFLTPFKWKNRILLLSSLLFYFYGEPHYFYLLLFSSMFHYFLGKRIERCQIPWKKKSLLCFTLLINFGILFYFKYYNFFCENLSSIFRVSLPYLSLSLPLGISFFTFQTASYSIDIYLGKIKSAENIFTFTTYLSMFPQLIAGPIVRYETVAQELKSRTIDFKNISLGIKRFIIGLFKKVMLADLLGQFLITLNDLAPSVLGFWLQAIASTLQLFLDFSGYSDMAIGLGLILGFHFLENFNYPLTSKSITDFWRRWHISLSSWFRDYLYIPLGGSHGSKKRVFLNLFLVWFFTGLWHGASWNFIFWGIYFWFFLVLEKSFLLSVLKRHRFFAHIYTLFVVLVGFVLFKNTHLSTLWISLKGMFGFLSLSFYNVETLFYFKDYLIILLVSIVLTTPFFKKIEEKIEEKIENVKTFQYIFSFTQPIFYLGIFLFCTAFIIDESFQAFLYFRF